MSWRISRERGGLVCLTLLLAACHPAVREDDQRQLNAAAAALDANATASNESPAP